MPSSALIAATRSSSVIRSPHPTFMTSPDTSDFAVAASWQAWTALATNVKSRLFDPSPWTTGGWPACIRRMNFGMTAAYSDSGSCRGPNTLKNRRLTVSSPNAWANARV